MGDCATYFDNDDELVGALESAAEGRLVDDRAARRARLEQMFSVEALAGRYRSILAGRPTALC